MLDLMAEYAGLPSAAVAAHTPALLDSCGGVSGLVDLAVQDPVAQQALLQLLKHTSVLSPASFQENMTSLLVSGLQGPGASYCMECMNVYYTKHAVLPMTEELWSALLECVAHPDTGVATTAMKLLYSSDPMRVLQTTNLMVVSDEVVLLRNWELLIMAGLSSPEAMAALTATAQWTAIVAAVSSEEDILLQLNVLQLISLLVTTEYGWKVVVHSMDMLAVIQRLSTAPGLYSWTATGLLKLLTSISEHCSDFTLLDSTVLIPILDTFASSSDPQISSLALTCICSVASISSSAYSATRPLVLRVCAAVSSDSTPDTTAALHGLAGVLSAEGMDTLQELVIGLTDPDESTTPGLVSGVTALNKYYSSTDELRYAAYRLTHEISKHSWGALAILKSNTVIETLLHVHGDSSKVGKEWRFTIVQCISLQLPNLTIGIPGALAERVRGVAAAGPFLSPASRTSPQVMTEQV